MDGKIHFYLLLIMLVTITVQGARPKNSLEKNFYGKRDGECGLALKKPYVNFLLHAMNRVLDFTCISCCVWTRIFSSEQAKLNELIFFF